MSLRRRLLVPCALVAIICLPLIVVGQDASDQVLRNRVIVSQTITDSDLQDLRVEDSTLYGVHVRGATIDRTRIDNAAITNATIRASTVQRASIWQATIEDSTLNGVYVESATLTGGSLTDATVRGARLNNVRLCNVLVLPEGRVDRTGCDGAGTPTAPTGGPTTPGGRTPVPPSGRTNVFTADGNTLAIFEFNGDPFDTSGNGRHLALGNAPDAYEASRFGRALRIGAQGPALDWTTYAGLLTRPFTIEMVVRPDVVDGYRKLFSSDDTLDSGWYIRSGTIMAYSGGTPLGTDTTVSAGREHVITFVSSTATDMLVYVDGERLGQNPYMFTPPPPQAIFLRDDRGGSEQFMGTIDAMRISSTARSDREIAAIADVVGV